LAIRSWINTGRENRIAVTDQMRNRAVLSIVVEIEALPAYTSKEGAAPVASFTAGP
jgi:hypothetical protein